MSTGARVDWESWEVEKPPADFVDRVMDIVGAEPRPSPMALGRRRWPRRAGLLAATAVAAGSLTVLAMIERSAHRAPVIVPGDDRAPSDRASIPRKPTDVAKELATSRVPWAGHAGTVVDRKRRDELHGRLVPALEAHGVERDTHTGLTIPSGASGPSHNLSKEYLQARIREDFYPMAAACYANALAREPTLRGRIVVDFMIVGDAKTGGVVDQAKINDATDIADAELTNCIRESMLSMVFAPPENDGWITVTYPFVFSPNDDEELRRDE